MKWASMDRQEDTQAGIHVAHAGPDKRPDHLAEAFQQAEVEVCLFGRVEPD